MRWTLQRGAGAGPVETVFLDVLPHLSANDFSGILAATLQGCGIALIPSILCSGHLREGRLAHVMPGWTSEPVTISAVTPGNRNASRLIRLFLDHCAATLPGLLARAEEPARPAGPGGDAG